MLFYYITDRRLFPGKPEEQKRLLLAKIAECARAGVDYIQLREKDLGGRDLYRLAEEAVRLIPSGGHTRLLINSRIDVAVACGAHGVHLPASGLSVSDARMIFARAGKKDAIVAASTHTVEEVREARDQGADFAVFGPVFEKDAMTVSEGLGRLEEACKVSIPVFALGGVTLESTGLCAEKGAAGVAAIRLFQQSEVVNWKSGH